MKPMHGGQRPGAGRPPKEGEKLERFTVHIPVSRVKKASEQKGQSMSEFIRRAILAALEKMGL